MVRVKCQCGKRLKLPDNCIGKIASCPGCSKKLWFVANGTPAQSVNPPALFIVQKGPEGRGLTIYVLGDQPVDVGKGAEVTLRLRAPSVSKRHCRISLGASGARVDDLNSTNGLLINAHKVAGHKLVDGDVVGIGEYELRFLGMGETDIADTLAAGATSIAQATGGYELNLLDDAVLDRTVSMAAPRRQTDREHPMGQDAKTLPHLANDELICPGCGTKWPAEARLCVTCGTDLVSGQRLQLDLGEEEEPQQKAAEAFSPPSPVNMAAFIKDCLGSFLMMGRFKDVLKLVFLTGVLALGLFLLSVPLGGLFIYIFRLLGAVVLLGWCVSYLFKVVVSGAAGEDELPELSVTDGWFEEGVVPFFKSLGIFAVAMAPAVLYSVIFGSHFLRAGDDPDVVLEILKWGGVFFLPIILLVVALGGFGSLLRPDLIFVTIARTFIPYVTTCIMAGLAFGVIEVCSYVSQTNASLFGGNQWLLGMVSVVLTVGCWAVAMRCVGLYYHHFKSRFAWSWG